MSLYDELSEAIGEMRVEREVMIGKTVKKVWFRELSADDAEEFFGKVDKDPKKNKGLRNRLLSKIVCAADGSPALSEAEAGRLSNQAANALQKIALEVNGLGESAQETAKNE
jgi:hypothetical protein